jgi:hypothetical protein
LPPSQDASSHGQKSAKIKAVTAGEKLRRRINAALRQAGTDAGTELVFSELENWLIDRACALEDWRVVLEGRRDAEQAREAGAVEPR